MRRFLAALGFWLLASIPAFTASSYLDTPLETSLQTALTVANFAALQTFNVGWYRTAPRVCTAGYSTVGVGAACYSWYGGDGATPNAVTIVASTSNSGAAGNWRINLDSSARLDVTQAGADPTGTADSTTALDNAFATGVPLTAPTGTFKISSCVAIQNASSLHGIPLNTTINLVTSTPGTCAFGANGSAGTLLNSIDIEGLVFTQQNADPTNCAISANFIADSQFRDIRVYGNSTIGSGFCLTQYQGVDLHNTWVENTLYSCYKIAGTSSAPPYYATDLHFLDKTRCDDGLHGLVMGDFINGLYLSGQVNFYHQAGAGIYQTSTNAANVMSSYHVFDTEFDSIGNPPTWTASTLFAAETFIQDSNGNVQRSGTSSGTSGSSAPSWNTTLGGTTTDGGVTWTMVSPLMPCLNMYYATDLQIGAGDRFGYCHGGSIRVQGGYQVKIANTQILSDGGVDAIYLGALSGNSPFVQDGEVVSNLINGGHFGVHVENGSYLINISANHFAGQSSWPIDLSGANCTTSLPQYTVSANIFDISSANGPVELGDNNENATNSCSRVAGNSGYSTQANSNGVLDHNAALYSVTAPTTITSSGSCFGTGSGSQDLPPKQLIDGSQLYERCDGVLTTSTGNTGELQATISFGGVTIATNTSAALPAGLTNAPVFIEERCTVKTSGSSAVFVCNGKLEYDGASGSPVDLPLVTASTGVSGLSTDVAAKLDATLAWAAVTGSPSAVMSTGIVAVLN